MLQNTQKMTVYRGDNISHKYFSLYSIKQGVKTLEKCIKAREQKIHLEAQKRLLKTLKKSCYVEGIKNFYCMAPNRPLKTLQKSC